MKKRLTLIESFSYPRTRAGDDYNFTFTLVDSDDIGKSEETNKTSRHSIKVGISATMQAVWKGRQENIDFEKVCYEYGKSEIISLLKNQILLDKQELEILSHTHPNECPFNTDRIYYKVGASEDFETD